MPQNKQKRAAIMGQPGYRTRPDRSGLDPVDSPAEEAFMEGTFIRNVITLKARTHNPFYLILMFIFGVIPFPVLVVFITSITVSQFGDIFSMSVFLLMLGLFTLLTGAITVNFLLSILELTRVISPAGSKKAGGIQPLRKKKLPKRRKDYR
jgi:hypothetical protein